MGNVPQYFTMNLILHITQRETWREAKLADTYRGDTLESEGFIHCSTPTQVIMVANMFYANQSDLVLLCIDAEKVKAEIRYEGVEEGELFPHIYGALNIDAVVKVVDFEGGEDGFNLPQEVVETRLIASLQPTAEKEEKE